MEQAETEHPRTGDKVRLFTDLDDEVNCQRGEMENRIEEQELGPFADRTSCHRWWAKQFRLMLSSCAYVLVDTIRRIGLAGTELAQARVGTIRLKLLKIGTVILRNTRRIRLLYASAYPYQALFRQVARRLSLRAGRPESVLSPARKKTGVGGKLSSSPLKKQEIA